MKLFYIILACLFISKNLIGQTKPLKIHILVADTAYTERSLDNLRSGYERDYKFHLKERIQEEFKRTELDTTSSRFSESERDSLVEIVNNIKYYNLIAYKSADLLYFFLDNKFPHLKIKLSPVKIQNEVEYTKLADIDSSDYIVSYKEIKALRDRKDNPLMKVKVILYSAKKNKVVLAVNVSGGAMNKGDWSTCDGEFECIMNNTVSNSSEAIANYLWSTLEKIK